MKQYQTLLRKIKEKGTWKDAAREGMPRTLSLFGAQSRYNLSDGFPILTTKKINFKHIVTELLWFLRGDTNIKYLIDNECNIWNEDSYNYYLKLCKNQKIGNEYIKSFDLFITAIKSGINMFSDHNLNDYKLGDCGAQYGKLWRSWESSIEYKDLIFSGNFSKIEYIDQIKDLIEGLEKNPIGRRHIITAWNPATLNDMALNACHILAQFNCRPITQYEKYDILAQLQVDVIFKDIDKFYQDRNLPKYYLDCHMYQRSADVFLGVPYNIASYSLLTHILAKACNMIPGDFVHSFGDVHIYENHMDQVNEILTRTPSELPTLKMTDRLPIYSGIYPNDLELSFDMFKVDDFQLENYNPQATIKAKLSTGLK